MDLRWTDSEKAFREEVRGFINANLPAATRERMKMGKSPTKAQVVEWQQILNKRGWAAPEWPAEHGGPGWTTAQRYIFREELMLAPAPSPLGFNINMCGPVVIAFGNAEQKALHLPGIAQGRARWCQGYSEPGAGSDLASLQTRADIDGDHFVINGSKIWTSQADRADWIFCLVRTDPAARKQEGISFLLIDMASPGITVRPIELISGHSEFCQTFFDNVRVPRSNLVGPLHGGWGVAKALLKHERKLMSEIGVESATRAYGAVECAKRYLPVSASGQVEDAVMRDRLARHEMQMHAIGLTQQRIIEESKARTGTGLTALVMKYCGTEEEKRRNELMVAMMGSQGLGWEGEEFSGAEIDTARGMLSTKALSIAGGSSEIQLNIIAKRALGLPGVI
jgi:alkylation response protein AidB-like acyl-CoA dehydrogenase